MLTNQLFFLLILCKGTTDYGVEDKLIFVLLIGITMVNIVSTSLLVNVHLAALLISQSVSKERRWQFSLTAAFSKHSKKQ